ncbi:DUF3558 domain-containing protein [Amycolatopsis decaplanina]|uniref:DUF3558 domain-containing protein n=1 Tax=Amycolatopsis decaplanina TaxID=208441 RepID=UPI001377D21C|nr:DUF3558 domain-containing protein [Amycolatopsis decaplanina]
MTVATVAVVAGVVAACTGKASDGTASPTSIASTGAAPSSSPSGLPYAGAPKVTNPLPASVLAGDPCKEALTAAQTGFLLGAPLDVFNDTTPGVGRACSWSNPESGSRILITYDTTTGQGLSKVYQNTRPKSGVWKPLASVEGFPGVGHAGNPGQEPPADFCQVSVGLADDLAFDVSAVVGQAKRGVVDPCDAAGKAAEAVVTTLKAKAA